MANLKETILVIPERTSSLLAPTCNQKVKELSESSDRLKRKGSTLSQQSRLSGTELIDVQLELSQVNYDLYTTLFRGLKQSWEAGTVTGDQFKMQGRNIWRKRFRVNRERTALHQERQAVIEQMAADNPKMAAAYKTAVMATFPANSMPPSLERRNKHKHDIWKAHLREYYNAVLPASPDQIEKGKKIWCPILKNYQAAEYRCAAHIVPHFIGYENAAWMFGDEGNMAAGSSDIWNFRNGLVMSKSLEKQFDAGDFVIVPIPGTQDGAPQRLRFVLLNTAYSHHQVGELEIHYSTLDGTELEFKGDGRPGLRNLYWHYMTSILRAVKWEKAGWDDPKIRFPDGPVWATPGPYLRKSMLRQLAVAMGDYEPKEQEFREGVCDGEGHKSPTDEEAIAADVAERLEIDTDDEDDSYYCRCRCDEEDEEER